MSLSLPAFAQNAHPQGCPEGSWFCAEVKVPPMPARPAPPTQQDRAPAPQLDDDEPAAPPAAPPPPARRPRRAAPPPPEAPPTYQEVPDAPPQVIVVTPGYGRYARQRVAPAPPPEAKPRPKWQSEFGLNLRVEGVALGHGTGYGSTAGMGGVGLSLRYRPVPHFAFDLGVDVLAGNDYNGFQRVEVPVTLNGMIFLNPRSRVQVYLLGGMHISRASVHSPFQAQQLSMSRDGMDYSAAYTYFGGQGGGGLEFRLSKHVALDLDAVGFVRSRIDDRADRNPEFIDANSGRTTNTSGGALFRGGLTFWW
jgi:hypothetical protein